MTTRRAFFASLAAIAAPLFARLALPAPPERKLLKAPTVTEEVLDDGDSPFRESHLYIFGGGEWRDAGVITKIEFDVITMARPIHPFSPKMA